ncbi:MAG: DUF3179 domain-containing (seleno)protein [Acidimicrobiales bacterium]
MGSRLRYLVPLAAVAVIISAVLVVISGDETSPGDPVADRAPPVDLATIDRGEARDFGPAPDLPDGPWSDETVTAINQIIESLVVEASPVAQITELGNSGDARLGWVVADLLRFVTDGASNQALVGAAQNLLPGLEVDPFNPWGGTTDQLIAWDLPVPDDQYLDFKRNLYGRIEPKWVELFTDDADIDWRHVSWGGVGIDDRDFGSDAACRCIPALDDPAVTAAAEGDWYPDDALVFGVVIGDEARAYPKNIMEVHEMVNDTLGGRDIAMPYCTLCGAAQAYFTDELPAPLAEAFGRPVFRTSGLLIRSNKMMFERNSRSFVDTFQGDATSGPLHDEGVVFDQASVITSTWGAWKQAHPDTTIVAEDGGIGRSYELDPLAGRDDNGPIFPIGDVDPRLPVQEPVLGVLTEDGRSIAFHVEAAAGILSGGDSIVVEGIELRLDGGGIRAFRNGEDAGGHQAFWFAWSQFYPDTAVWPLDYQSG